MTQVVLDASAVLALLHQEPGSQFVLNAMGSAIISSVNFVEVGTKLARNHSLADAMAILEELRLNIIPFDEEQAVEAINVVSMIQPVGLSLGDRACLALARSKGLPVLTADKIWKTLNVGVEVRVIR